MRAAALIRNQGPRRGALILAGLAARTQHGAYTVHSGDLHQWHGAASSSSTRQAGTRHAKLRHLLNWHSGSQSQRGADTCGWRVGCDVLGALLWHLACPRPRPANGPPIHQLTPAEQLLQLPTALLERSCAFDAPCEWVSNMQDQVRTARAKAISPLAGDRH